MKELKVELLKFSKKIGDQGDTAASETLLRHIEIATEPREMVAKKPSGTNVKSIFKH